MLDHCCNDILTCVDSMLLTVCVCVQICDCVSELGSIEIDEPGWPELLPTLFQCVASSNVGMQVSALSIFGDLAMYVGDSLKPQLPQLVQVSEGNNRNRNLQDHPCVSKHGNTRGKQNEMVSSVDKHSTKIERPGSLCVRDQGVFRGGDTCCKRKQREGRSRGAWVSIKSGGGILRAED